MKKTKIIDWKYIYYGIFLIPFVVSPFAMKPYEIPKISWMILFIAIFLLLCAIGFLKGRIKLYINKPVILVLALWILSFAISTLLSVSPIESFWGSFERMQGMLTMLYYIIHFIICLQLFKRKKEQTVFIWMVLIIGCILSLHAILQWFGFDPLQIGNIDLVSGRSYATIGQPNLLGQLLIAPFYAGLILFANTFVIDNKDLIKKILLAAATFLVAAGIFTTYNRATILALIIGLGLFLLYNKRIKVSHGAIAIGTITTLAVITLILFGGSLRSVNTRMVLWENSVPLTTNNLIIGSGLETYYQTFQTVLDKELYETETLYNIPDRVHNETFQTLLDQGLFGLILYLLNIVFLGWIYFSRRAETPESKIALFSIITTIISLQFSFAMSSHMVLLLGLWAVLLHTTIRFRPIKIKANISGRIAALLIVLLFSYFSFAHAFVITRANTMLKKGIETYFVDYEDAYQSFDEMLDTAPYYRHLHYSAVHFLAARNRLIQHPELKDKLKQRVEELKTITNNGYHYNISAAKLALALDDYEDAVKNFEEASRKAPNFPLIYQEWGNAAYENADFDTAVEKYEKLISLAPPYWQNPAAKSILETDSEYAEKHRIFKKTHGLFYDALNKLAFIYNETGQTLKAEELKLYIQ